MIRERETLNSNFLAGSTLLFSRVVGAQYDSEEFLEPVKGAGNLDMYITWEWLMRIQGSLDINS